MTSPVSVVLLNYNTRDLTLDSLARFASAAQALGWQVIVVDNASTDGSTEAVAAYFPAVTVVRLIENRGYAAGNNQGLEVATGEAVILLNSDVLVGIEQLQALVDYLKANPEVGAVSAGLRTAEGAAQAFTFGGDPSLLYLLRRGIGRLFRLSPLHDWAVTEPLTVDWVSGACLCVRREVIEQIGGLDENFFLYFEDVDWCRRMRLAGWRVVYNPRVQVVHLGGQSQPARRVANRQYGESLRLYYRKWYGEALAECVGLLFPLFRWVMR
ncbi:MAG: glycosyltransferase family 2 protein [Chloroflexi bacterium]|nr:glycosyltransferase family 2 protein [Chloroflexota bacterium]